jgi:hypothetical protein
MFDYLVFDTVNFGYAVYNNSQGPSKAEFKQSVMKIGNKKVYRLLLKECIETVSFLRQKYLKDGGELIFLYDNYTSREELKEMLKPLKSSDSRKQQNPEYKAQRKSERAEFYNTLDIFRYYGLVGENRVHTVRIPHLEADDLVKPCLTHVRATQPEASVLMITNDSDWCRYLDGKTLYLPEIYKEPVGREKFKERWHYEPSEETVVLYKILYGDDADNIQPVFPEFDSKLKRFIMEKFTSVVDFMFEASSTPELKEYVVLIKDRELDIKMAYQLISAIPVSTAHFRQVYTTGRGSTVMRKQLDTLIFGEEEKQEEQKFTFGGVVPRYTPSGSKS